MIKLKEKPKVIFITLGSKCNLNCEYCIEHHATNLKIPDMEINKDIINFIKKQAPVEVRFYGGEPLLYLNKIKKITSKLSDKKNIQFSIITNGKLITEEIVKFFNQNNFDVGISWDGSKSTETRGYDVIKEKEELILKINNLSFDFVLSAKTDLYDFYLNTKKYNDKYYNLHNYPINIYVSEIYDTAGVLTEFTKFNLKKLQTSMKKLLDETRRALDKKEKTPSDKSLIIMLKNILGQISTSKTIDQCFCGNGTEKISIDLSGNIYQCHSTNSIIGHINDIYNKKLNKNNIITQKNIEKYCKSCPVLRFCKGGCPLITQDKKIKTDYCSFRKIYYGQYINLLKELKIKIKEEH